jgi:hypothetical protein
MNVAVSTYAAEVSELLPSFTSRERFGAAAEAEVKAQTATLGVSARLYTEATPARGVTADYRCHTLVAVNFHSTPTLASITLENLQKTKVGQDFPQAKRLFNGQYLVNITASSGDSGSAAVLHDFVDARSANIYVSPTDYLVMRRSLYCVCGARCLIALMLCYRDRTGDWLRHHWCFCKHQPFRQPDRRR